VAHFLLIFIFGTMKAILIWSEEGEFEKNENYLVHRRQTRDGEKSSKRDSTSASQSSN
jgi:hypothetical protein